MTKYCPLCESEYQDAVLVCPDDSEKLFDAPSLKIDRTLSADIFAASNEIEAECIVALLEDIGIPAQLFRPQVTPFPNLGDEHFVVAVRVIDKEPALEAIRTAQQDGVVSTSGSFL
jgi:hypothetical protein